MKQYYHQTYFHRLPYDLTYYIGKYLRSGHGQFKGSLNESGLNQDPNSPSALP